MGGSREAAIRQMREKAAGATATPPNVFDIPQSHLQELKDADREELRRRLEAEAAQNDSNVSEEEALQRQRDTELLLRKARSHYKDAVNSIEK